MNLKQHYPDMNILFDNLESLIDAPDGIEKARELILLFAVQGKLVKQDPNEEPASELLKKIKKEKEKLIADGKIKKQNDVEPINDDEKPFELPTGWEYESLGNIAHLITKGSTPTTYGFSYLTEGIPFIKVENIENGEIVYNDYMQFISEEAHEFQSRSKLQNQDVLFSIAGTIGETCIVKKENLPANTNQALAIIRGTQTVFLPNYLKIMLDSFVSKVIKDRARGGAMNNISLGDLKDLVTPIPPLNEQKRIVEKVDSLMALLDELEEKRERRNHKRIKLNNASLEKLLTSKDDKELQTNWKRIEENFSTLYSVPGNVEKLKQTILQLAVQGKLTEQNPKDETASELLKKIKKEKEKLFAEGKIKKLNELPPIKAEEKPFELPKGWEWVRLGELIELISGQHIQSLDYNSKGVGLPYITGPADFGLLYPIITKWTDKPKVIASKDDILITVKGAGLGKLNINNIDSLVISRQLMAIRSIQLNSNYIFHYLKSKFSLFQHSGTGIAIPGLSREDITYLCFPLPPLNEQKHIVEKVNELMSLCNALEEKLTKKEATAEKLVGAVVNTVANKTTKPKDDK